jgi:putative ABC transport system permease protein
MSHILSWPRDLILDSRFALRQFRREPLVFTAVVLTLALGIGATTAMFTIVNGVLLRPLPYRDPDRLVAVADLNYRGEFLHLKEHSRTLEPAAYTNGSDVTVTGRGEPIRIVAASLSPEIFAVLRVAPAIGRGFVDADGRPGAEPIVLLSAGFWRAYFGADSSVVGQRLVIDGSPATIAGVMPTRFAFPSERPQLWRPLVIDRANPIALWARNAWMVARLRPGVTREAARAELRTLVPGMRARFPWKMPETHGADADAIPLAERTVGPVRPMLLLLLGAVAAVLLVVCVNVTNLILARSASRQRELAVRAALGAGRARLFRQLLAESLILSAVAGLLGLVLAYAGLESFAARLPEGTPRVRDIAIDWRVVLVIAGISVFAGVASGLLPALRVAFGRVHAELRDGGRSGISRIQQRAAGLLAGAELALAVMLVVCAALLLTSLRNLLASDPGFNTEHLVTATIAPSQARYPDDVRRRAFLEEVLTRVRQVPGVHRAAAGSAIPFGGNANGSVFIIEGRPHPAQTGDWPQAHVRATMTPGYLQTVGIPLLAGRDFEERDRAGAPGVIVVSRSLAEKYWPGQDAVGARIQFPGQTTWMTIVGITGDARWSTLLESRTTTLYVSLAQSNVGATRIVVRGDSEARELAPKLRDAVWAMDRDTPVSDVADVSILVSGSAARPRFTAMVVAVFAAVALLLAAIGVYGVLAHAVTRRTREIGVRIALGAQAPEVLRLVLAQGFLVGVGGIAAGLVGAALLARTLRGLLVGVTPLQPSLYAASAAALMAVAMFAAYLPARRATRVDPAVALRTE